jgi:hypothetical protein
VTAAALAAQLVASPDSWWVVDLRADAGLAKGSLPGAIAAGSFERAATVVAGLVPTRRLLVFAQGDLEAPPKGVVSFPGEVFVLAGGYDAWTAEVLTKPSAPPDPTAAQLDAFRTRAALNSHFTGTAAVAAPAPTEARPVAPQAAAPKKGGGC